MFKLRFFGPGEGIALALLIVIYFPCFARGDEIIGQRILHQQYAGTPLRLNTIGISFAVTKPGTTVGDFDIIDMFYKYKLSNADVGQSFTVDASNDPNFTQAADRFTNGTNESIIVGINWNNTPGFFNGSGGGGSESYFFHDDLAGVAPPFDLIGYELDRIVMTVNSLDLAVPGPDPNGDGNWTDVHADLTFTFFGTAVPEPSTIALAAIGLVIFAIGRWRSC